MRSASRVVIYGIIATLLIYVLLFAGIPSTLYFLVLFLACLVAGAAFSRVRYSVSMGMGYYSLLVLLASSFSWLGVHYSGARYVYPLLLVRAIFSPASGYVGEIYLFAAGIAVSILGGAFGALIVMGILRASGYTPDTLGEEMARLVARLQELEQERVKLEEELRICDIIEQGAKTRIARNEMSQSDYEAVINSNATYREKLNTRLSEVQADLGHVKLDIEARRKAKQEMRSTNKEGRSLE
ncbi:MAG: hypothetical protein QXP70_03215 [Methanomassiliicoccales archaeon]